MESNNQQSVVKYIRDIAGDLFLDRRATCTSLYYFHKFTSCFDTWDIKDNIIIAAACVFIACKAEESRRRINFIISICIKLCGINPKSQDEIQVFKNRIFQRERDVLDAIKFKFSVEHPHRFLFLLIKLLFPEDNNKDEIRDLAKIVWFILNDSLSIPLCIHYPPQLISVAALRFAEKIITKTAMKTILPHNWFDILQKDLSISISISDLDEIERQLSEAVDASGILENIRNTESSSNPKKRNREDNPTL